MEEFISLWLSGRLWEQQKGGRTVKRKICIQDRLFWVFHDVIVYV